MDIFYATPEARDDIVALDGVMGACTLLTIIHALTSKSGSFVLVLACLLMALAVEESSIHFGATHCHEDGLVNVTKCSSVNSILFYVHWVYANLILAEKWTKKTPQLFPAAAALLQLLYGVGYEFQGPTFSWWRYTDANINGVFDDRLFGFPVMAVLFHAAMGYGFAQAASLTNIRGKPGLLSLVGTVVLSMPIALLFDLPVRSLMTYLHCSTFLGVTFSLATLVVLPLLAWGRGVGGTRSEPILFVQALVWHSFFIWTASRSAIREQQPDLFVIVLTLAVCSLTLQGAIAFHSGGESEGSQKKKSKKN